MKKVLLLLILCLVVINVKAEEKPVIISHKVMVTNKEGTICYQDGSKTDITLPYKTMLIASYDIVGSYINVYNDDYNCDVKYSDVSSNTQKFSLDTDGVLEITPVYAIVLSNSGLNMRIGPSVTYAKRLAIPQNTILKLTHKAGTYWYYTEYNEKDGWVTSMNKYIGYDFNRVLINYQKTKLYDANGITVLTTIPENTEITDYIKIDNINDNGLKYYVIYNGTKGYIRDMLYKTNGIGKIKLLKDVEIKDDNGNPVKRMSSGSELEYSMVDLNGSFYFPSKNVLIKLNDDDYEYIKETKPLVKEKGYIGEGLFGEEKIERNIEIKQEEVEDKKIETEESNTKEIIIIGLLVGLLIAIITLVIVIRNNKKPIVNNIE